MVNQIFKFIQVLISSSVNFNTLSPTCFPSTAKCNKIWSSLVSITLPNGRPAAITTLSPFLASLFLRKYYQFSTNLITKPLRSAFNSAVADSIAKSIYPFC